DFVARYGGEEFVVVLPDTDKVGAVQTAERIRQNYKNHKIKNLTGEGFLQSTCSLGVATLKGSSFATIDEMIEHADKNLYTAKKSGRDRVIAD
ncbi:MAG TPA: GGDEF domain-containing protein, partial [Bdellovibrionales bacterium]|nr:GGDEF domain-containing protein [Bdellovibrionales bacterium]